MAARAPARAARSGKPDRPRARIASYPAALTNATRPSHPPVPTCAGDRQPFLTTIASNGASQDYNSLHSAVEHNMLNANYGGAQGFDNDDGSSW